jgi:hypothetical protein
MKEFFSPRVVDVGRLKLGSSMVFDFGSSWTPINGLVDECDHQNVKIEAGQHDALSSFFI